MRFTVLTIAGRPMLLPSVARSIADAAKPADVDVRWVVKCNPDHLLGWTEHLRIWNETLASLSGTWVLLLSDDNLLHTGMLLKWREILEHAPEVKVVHFRQQFGPKSFRVSGSDHLGSGKCDGGQFVFDVDYYLSFGWRYEEFGYEGELFRRMYAAKPEAFFFLDETYTYHDRLNW